MTGRKQLVLRPYQELSKSMILDVPANEGVQGVGVWLDLGLGKTPTTLSAIVDSLTDRFDTTRWLVVGPKLVVQDSWPTQLDRWDQFKGLTYRVLEAEDLDLEPAVLVSRMTSSGERKDQAVRKDLVRPDDIVVRRAGLNGSNPKATRAKLLGWSEDIHLISWNNWPHLVRIMRDKWPYDGVVFDEAEFLQDSTGDWHKAAWHVVHRLKRVSRVIELSGLPTPNGRAQLHGQIRILDGGKRLGRTKEEFKTNWLMPVKMNRHTGQVYKWGVPEHLHEKMDEAISDIVFSLKGGVELPEWRINDVMVTLDGPTQAAYEALERDSILFDAKGAATVVAPTEAVLIDKLRQLCTGAAYAEETVKGGVLCTGDAKIRRIEEMIQELKRPVVIAYQWDHEWPRLQKAFKGLKNISDPGVLAEAKAGKLQVVAGQCQSFSHGVDGLQHAYRDVIWTAPTYNYGVWEQLRKRFHRDGVQGEVMVHRLIARGTIEEYVAWEVLPAKLDEADAVLMAADLLRKRRLPTREN